MAAPADPKALKDDMKRRMDSTMETLKKEFQGLRTGRASPALLEPIRERWERATPEQQQRYLERARFWASLTPEQ